MRLLTHNVLRSPMKDAVEGYPLKIEATDVQVRSRRVLSRRQMLVPQSVRMLQEVDRRRTLQTATADAELREAARCFLAGCAFNTMSFCASMRRSTAFIKRARGHNYTARWPPL